MSPLYGTTPETMTSQWSSSRKRPLIHCIQAILASASLPLPEIKNQGRETIPDAMTQHSRRNRSNTRIFATIFTMWSPWVP